jgi:hypothetical protein
LWKSEHVKKFLNRTDVEQIIATARPMAGRRRIHSGSSVPITAKSNETA